MILFRFIFLSFSLWAEIRIAISSHPSNLDPFNATDANSQNMNRLLHKSLVDFNKKMSFECILCSSFQEKIQNGKYEITFNLKSGEHFWDGEEVTAADVERSVKYYQDHQINSIFRTAFLEIEKIYVLEKYKVKFVYTTFKLEHLSNLCLLKIIKINPGHGDNLQRIIGSGPYKMESLDPMVLVPAFDQKKPRLIFKVVKDETTLALKLINKEIDLSVASISPRKEAWLKKNNADLKAWTVASSNYFYLGLNLKQDHLKSRNIRKALSLLIPRKQLIAYKIKDSGVLSNGLFSTAFSKIYFPFPIDEFNPKAAIKIFRQEGYVKKGNGFLSRNGKEFILDWKVNNNKSSFEIVEIIKRSFEDVGIKVKLTSQEWGTFSRNFKSGAYDVVLASWQGFTGADMLNFTFHSKKIPPAGGNRGYYLNKDVDQLLDQAEAEIEENKRNNIYRQVQEKINFDMPYINLWHPNVSWLGRRCLFGLDLLPTGSFVPLLNIESKCQEKF